MMQQALRVLGAALFFPAIACIAVPNGVFLSNLTEIPFVPDGRSILLGIAFALTLTTAPLFWFAEKRRVASALSKLLVVFAACILIWDAAGTWVEGRSLWVVALADLGVFGAVVWAISRVRPASLISVVSVIGPCLFVMNIWSHLGAVERLEASRKGPGSFDLVPLSSLEPGSSREIDVTALKVAGASRVVSGEKARPVEVLALPISSGTDAALLDLGESVSEQAGYVRIRARSEGASFRFRLEGKTVREGAPRADWVNQRRMMPSQELRDFDVAFPAGVRLDTLKFLHGFHLPKNGRLFVESVKLVSGEATEDPPGNVYHIILDAYQSEALPHVRKTHPDLVDLPFTYFENFHTNAPRTWLSNAQLAWSRYYEGEAIIPWQRDAYPFGLFAELASAGINLRLYPHYPYYKSPASETNVVTVELLKELVSPEAYRRSIFDLSVQRLLPNSIRTWLNEGRDLTMWDYGFSLMDTVLGEPIKPAATDIPFFSQQLFRRFLAAEAQRPARGQYHFVHLILPHHPFVLDRDGKFVRWGDEVSAEQRYMEQVLCSHRLIADLVERLKELDRFEDSMVVVHGDHGRYWRPQDRGALAEYAPLEASEMTRDEADKKPSDGWASSAVAVRASSLLWIKFPGAKQSETSQKPAQIIDVAPTILKHFGLVGEGFQGVPVQDLTPETKRRHSFQGVNCVPQNGRPDTMSTYEREGDRWIHRETTATNRSNY